MKLLRVLAAIVAGWLMLAPAQAQLVDRGVTTATGKSWTIVVAPDLNDDFARLYTMAPAVCGTVAGGTTNYTCSVSPAIGAKTVTPRLQVTPNATNTGAVQLNPNSTGLASVVKTGGAALASGDFVAGQIYDLWWDAANSRYQIVGQVGGGSGAGTVTSVGTGAGLTGGPITGTGTIAMANMANGTIKCRTTAGTGAPEDCTATQARNIVLGAPADDQVPVGDSSTATTWRTLPDSDGATQKLQYDQATNSFTAGTDDDVPEVGDFGALAATSPITQSGGTISTSIATGRLVGRTTASAGVMEQITPDATLALAAGGLSVVDVTCTGCLGATEIAALDAGDTTTGTFADARVDGSLEADELILSGDVDGSANGNDIDEAAVEVELEGVLDLADLQGDLPLGTKTSGNYMSGLSAGAGVAVTHTPAEGSTATVALDYSSAAGNPALGAGQCRFAVDTTAQIVCEGTTADNFETRIVVTDPTADRQVTVPNADTVIPQAVTCGGTDKLSSLDPATGAFTCTTDAGGAGSGDNISVNGSAATDADFDDTTPAAPSGGLNVLWQKDSGTPNNLSGYVPAVLGKKTIAVPAGALRPRASNGCDNGTAFSGTNIEVPMCSFDPGTDERAQFVVFMPKSADESAGLDAQFIWSTTGASGNAIWTIACVAVSDDDPVDGSFGTAQSVTDGVTAANDQMISSFTSTVTPGGSWTEGDSLYCQVTRDADNGSDTLASDARLLGIRVRYTINALRDD